MNAARILRQHFEDLQRAGVTHTPHALTEVVTTLLAQETVEVESSAENDRTNPSRNEETASTASAIPRLGKRPANSATNPDVATPKPTQVASTPSTPTASSKSTASQSTAAHRTVSVPTDANLDDRIAGLASVADQVAACQKCQDLANGRTQTVFGVGNPDAEVMFIGEAPGADEDRLGEPFVGAAGQLLNKIITASQMTREEIYICNILRCRPPGNRNPAPVEAENCREFLDAQIDLVQPKYIVCWGSIAAQTLLNSKTSIGRMRGKFFDYHGIKVACTYHPSYLLRNPSAKKMVWEDIKFVRADMGISLD